MSVQCAYTRGYITFECWKKESNREGESMFSSIDAEIKGQTQIYGLD